ncbi:SRPBCC family protein [Nonomuraea rhodomycinica]|uniref:SRPBCC family protein n=1 Tax=Nonomuraea rhodomycinica TaxID=1712872 RepID=A0A7Y6MFP5_9ACTN|nr:SRPBCC family protein [Nonomuraea rhodomycinica]NUW46142.1 SRPBCC family protein [Nonomuraea rhodomycinica]
MNTQEATRFVDAPPSRVRRALLTPRALPDWNPAFHTVEGPAHAATGVEYPMTVRGGLSGHWRYTAIDDRSIHTAWQVPGFRETGVWRLEPHGSGTVVTHAFGHHGPLALVLSKAYRGVGELRLDRLARRVTRPAP